MRKIEVEKIIEVIDNIKDFTKTMDFKTSTFINQQVIQARPILEKELARLENEKIDINSPRLLLLSTEELDSTQTLVDLANTKMSELVENNYKIIDFGLYEGKTPDVYVYIKYTN